LSETIGPLDWRPGPRKLGLNLANKIKMTPPLVTSSPREPQTQNEKIFFSISTSRLAESADGFEQLPSSIGWRFIALQTLRQNYGDGGTEWVPLYFVLLGNAIGW